MKKLLLIALLIAVFSLVFAIPASAETMADCPHPMEATIQSLRDCVQHAAANGWITDPGVTASLLYKLDAAQAALQNGQRVTAVYILQSFILQVQALSGVQIDATHAAHIVMHAQMVIQAIQ